MNSLKSATQTPIQSFVTKNQFNPSTTINQFNQSATQTPNKSVCRTNNNSIILLHTNTNTNTHTHTLTHTHSHTHTHTHTHKGSAKKCIRIVRDVIYGLLFEVELNYGSTV